MALKNPLPGIYFQAETSETEESLPRMDIVAFIGLAESGPLHTPVPIEDKNRFREIFGNDLELAQDAETHEKQYAYLASSVKAFFLNGGRRCWVIRVADTKAQSNLFPLTGLVCVDNVNNTFLPAVACARSEGSWSDKLRFSTVLTGEAINVEYIDPDNWNIDIFENIRVLPGDLVQLTFSDNNLLLMRCIESIETVSDNRKPIKRIQGKDYWFLRGYLSAETISFEAVLRTPLGKKRQCTLWLPDEKNPSFRVSLNLMMLEITAPCSLLSLEINESGEPIQSLLPSLKLLLIVTSVEPTSETSSPLEEKMIMKGEEGFWILDEVKGRELAGQCIGEVQSQKILANRLSFQISEWKDQEMSIHLSNLAFCKQHPRFWGNLPDDISLFCLNDDLSNRPSFLDMEASEPRFPLAAPKERVCPIYLPVGMPVMPDVTTTQGPINPVEPDTALQRSGLKDFSADLFLDLSLKQTSSESLLQEAWNKRYRSDDHDIVPLHGMHSVLELDEVTIISIPDAIHKAWVQEPQEPKVSPSDVLQAPDLKSNIQFKDHDTFVLSWSGVEGADQYILEEGTDPAFLVSSPAYTGNDITCQVRTQNKGVYYYRVKAIRNTMMSCWSNTQMLIVPYSEFEECQPSLLKAPELHKIDRFGDNCRIHWTPVPRAIHYTLQEAADPGFFASSTIHKGIEYLFSWEDIPVNDNERLREFLKQNFGIDWVKTAKIEKIDNGNTIKISTQKNHLSLKLNDEQTEVNLEIDDARTDKFDVKIENSKLNIYGIDKTFSFKARYEGIYYYRVRAFNGNSWGPWSNTDYIVFDLLPLWTVQNPDTYDNFNLLTIHRSLLQMCTARGDMLAVLTLPSHYQEKDVMTHVNELKLKRFLKSKKEVVVVPLNQREKHMLSFGALYHPWILTSGKGSFIIPPDGAVCGLMASKAISEGAWIAPANEPLKGVHSLEPIISLKAWTTLFEHQVNLIRPDPRGYLTLSANTLSPDLHLQHTNVRRLLILLRRLALREGTTYVFQPNDEGFHRLIRHTFYQLLANLYLLGAFAGDTPDKAYRVVADASVNTQKSLEQGRFIVDLQVAPSKPMVFVTVRLVQTGHEMSVVMEV